MGEDAPFIDCPNCGADLYLDVPHDCPVTGGTVEVTLAGEETALD